MGKEKKRGGKKKKRTEDDDNDDQDNKEKNLVKDRKSLANILHAVRNSLALLASFNHLADHLVQADIPVLVGIDGIEALLGLLAVDGAHDLNDIVHREGLLALNDKGHPNTAGHGFRATDLFKGLDDDGVGRVGVEDLLAGDLRGDVAKDRGDLVTETADVTDEPHRRGCDTLLPAGLVPSEHDLDTIVDDIVLFGKLRAVHGEKCARGLVHEAEEKDLALGVVDAVGKGALVVTDADELHQELLAEQDGGRDKERKKDADDDVGPRAVGAIPHELERQPRGEAPEEERKRYFERAQDGGVLPRAGADDAAEEHEDEGQDMGDQLPDPEGQPGDLDPDEEQEQAVAVTVA